MQKWCEKQTKNSFDSIQSNNFIYNNIDKNIQIFLYNKIKKGMEDVICQYISF